MIQQDQCKQIKANDFDGLSIKILKIAKPAIVKHKK